MLTLKEIQNLFSDFCFQWDYYIESYDGRISTLLLKHKKYSDLRASYIYIDFSNRLIRPYTIFISNPKDLLSDCLQFEELRDLILVMHFIFDKLDMEE